MSLLPNLDQMTDNEKLAVLESIQKSIAESKEIQKKKIGENVDLVVQALKKIESDIQNRFDAVGNTIEKRVLSIKDGRDGSNGTDGRDGKDGKSGRDGAKGDKGDAGQNGRDGVDGVDGVSVVNANIDFDGSLIISLSDGREINVGEVVSADIAEKIKVINTMSTNAAIAVKEESTTITSGVKSINFVGSGITATTSGDDVTVTVSGGSGTVTSVAATAGTGISITGSPITTSGTLNITNTAPDQTVALTQAGTTTITGTYPNFTISSADQFQGTVTSVTGTSPVASSGGATPAISLAASYGDTQNPYASKTANFVLAAPNGSAGVPTFRAIVAADIPTLNQSTTGSAATLTTPRAIYGNNFDGSAALTQIIASTYGGTGNGFTKFTGATTAEKTYTLPDASSTIVVQGGALGTPSSGTVTNLTGTASININGTVGATTASSGAFTTLSATGVTTVQAGTAALPAITTTGDTNTGIFFPAADTIAFTEGGAEAARIDSSGNFGIGTTSPSSYGLLSVVSSTAGSAKISIQDTSGGASPAPLLQFGVNSSNGFNTSDAARVWTTSPSGSTASLNFAAYNGGAPTTAQMTLTGGNVGIGTSSPGGKFEVSGGRSIFAANSEPYSVYLRYNGSTNGFYIGSPSADAMAFSSYGGTERMRIDSSGNVFVGATSGYGGVKFYIQGTAGASNANSIFGVASATAGDTTYPGVLFSKADNNSTTSQVFVRFSIAANTAASGQINANGVSAVAFGSWSDKRLKENITELPSQLANIMALRPVEFDYIESEGGGHQIGFIAQDVQEIYPDLVGERSDGMLTLTDLNKNDARLIKCIQEQQALITALTARITALENK